jgi:hypothetical protein
VASMSYMGKPIIMLEMTVGEAELTRGGSGGYYGMWEWEICGTVDVSCGTCDARAVRHSGYCAGGRWVDSIFKLIAGFPIHRGQRQRSICRRRL